MLARCGVHGSGKEKLDSIGTFFTQLFQLPFFTNQKWRQEDRPWLEKIEYSCLLSFHSQRKVLSIEPLRWVERQMLLQFDCLQKSDHYQYLHPLCHAYKWRSAEKSNINVWFRFKYAQKWNCAALLFPKNVCLPISTVYSCICEQFIYSQDRSAADWYWE